MNWMRRTGIVALLTASLLVVAATSGLAADIGSVVDDAAATGVYLDSAVSISESDATEIVSAARNNGSRFYLIVLNDTPLGGNTAFAEAVYDELGISSGTVLVLSPEDVGYLSENEGFTESDMTDAIDFANAAGGSDAQYAANFVVGLFGDSVAAEPVPEPAQTQTTTGAAAAAESSDGGGAGFLWFIIIVGGIGLLVFFMVRSSGKKSADAAAEQMATVRAAIQKQVDAVANDILDMEDEVRVAGNAEVDRFYGEASDTYRTVTERLQQADSPQELLEISNDLDVAIWQLDCAEAVLDGKPKPSRPEAKRLEPERRPDERVTIPPPRPDYQRRPSRRSSYLGPGMLEILIGVAGQVLAGGRRGRGGGFGSVFGRPASRSPRSSTPQARGGGGVVPGPGSLVHRRSSRRSSSRSSSRRRSGGGRIRGGGKRRG
ncbi:MAG: hypothetical protein QNJ89_03845 [Acidimicrobiia bacterium]|nr:hypothetical protein [Acidimicrobiia bacterium]